MAPGSFCPKYLTSSTLRYPRKVNLGETKLFHVVYVFFFAVREEIELASELTNDPDADPEVRPGLYQGDMAMDDEIYNYWRVGLKWDIFSEKKWKNATIPYVISPLYGKNARSVRFTIFNDSYRRTVRVRYDLQGDSHSKLHDVPEVRSVERKEQGLHPDLADKVPERVLVLHRTSRRPANRKPRTAQPRRAQLPRNGRPGDPRADARHRNIPRTIPLGPGQIR